MRKTADDYLTLYKKALDQFVEGPPVDKNRTFDNTFGILAECESELIGGYHTEYGSMKLGFYLFAEYVNMFISAAIISILFLGGYNFPGMDSFSGNILAIMCLGAFFTKIVLIIFIFMWIRWTIPRFRYDQLMHLGWKKLIPIALINLMITGIIIAFTKGWFN